MPVRIAATANCDDVVIFWRIDTALPDCWGFRKEVDLKALDEVVNGAKEAVLFLMFQPGGAKTLGRFANAWTRRESCTSKAS